MRHDEAFLHALGATLSVSAEPALSPDRINLIGAALGLSEPEVYDLAAELQRQGVIRFDRTRLALTELGRSRLSSTSSFGDVSQQGVLNIIQNSGPIDLGSHATYSGPGAGASAQASHDSGSHLGALVAALAELRQLAESLRPEEREPVQRLEAEVSAAVDETGQSGTIGAAVGGRLVQVDEALKAANSISEQLAGKLSLAARLLGPVLEWARALFG